MAEIKRASSPEAAAAAALCYLAASDTATLDPDGDLTAALWPFDFEDYRPARTVLKNLRIAEEYIEQAINLAEERVSDDEDDDDE